MQYDVKTPAEYLDNLEDDWRREKLGVLRALIKKTAPDLVEGIHYKMLSYQDERGVIFHLNAQKNYVSLYVGDARKIDPEGLLLKGIDVGKGCIRFKKSTPIDTTNIAQFLKKLISLWKKGEDIGC
ncbi:iron chaperone [Aliikangiella coralliicola]|uniref:DUF1801 domain-containing protein n=1 Tax=Aliikangiella coralliicola TaxID=2592383 RepID=A0A545UIN7_9GAMM|nr:DUF1801 domain-containing protein [Aliikangiella coralliicola]TQV89329.1 DUF1801 domain-containing protein [Aliikangiella coralliicola]